MAPRPLGWWDLGGRLDRALAFEELAPLFGDTVTAFEFHSIVALYSDIRLDRTSLEVVASDSHHDAQCTCAARLGDIAIALTTAAGRALLAGFTGPGGAAPHGGVRLELGANGAPLELRGAGSPRRVLFSVEAVALPDDVRLMHALTVVIWGEDRD